MIKSETYRYYRTHGSSSLMYDRVLPLVTQPQMDLAELCNSESSFGKHLRDSCPH
ncbi:hypothetical protein J6590_012825, partial [Homalodisca vitripennis]